MKSSLKTLLQSFTSHSQTITLLIRFWSLIFSVFQNYEEILQSSVIKELTCNAGDTGDTGSIPQLGRSPEGGYGNPLQYSCLENFMGRGTWQAIGLQLQDYRVANSQIRLKRLNIHAYRIIKTESYHMQILYLASYTQHNISNIQLCFLYIISLFL